jgi:hypothetical protein
VSARQFVSPCFAFSPPSTPSAIWTLTASVRGITHAVGGLLLLLAHPFAFGLNINYYSVYAESALICKYWGCDGLLIASGGRDL